MKGNGFSALVLSTVLGMAETTAFGIGVQVTTQKPSYYPGEKLTVQVIATNGQQTGVLLTFNTTIQAIYQIDSYHPNWLGGQIITYATVPGMGAYSWPIVHDWSDYRVPVGIHTLLGEVINYGISPPATFEIVPAPIPQTNFVVDFDLIPGTQALVGNLIAYEASGVRFRSLGDGNCGLAGSATNRNLSAYYSTYPTGFNIVADFDRPFYGAAVKISGGTGCQITMLALDAQSNILASAISPPISTPGVFLPISLHTAEPISTLQWWPSDPRCGVNIDDLYLELSPSESTVEVTLQIERTGDNLRVFWPANVSHVGLEMTSDCSGGPWQILPASVETNSVVVLITSEPCFFRLRLR
jgi:hypothetical protein